MLCVKFDTESQHSNFLLAFVAIMKKKQVAQLLWSQGCTKRGAKTFQFNFSRDLLKKLHVNAKVLCAKFDYKRPDGVGGIGGRTDRQTHTDKTKNMSPLSSSGPSTGDGPLCGNKGPSTGGEPLCGNKGPSIGGEPLCGNK